MFNVPFIKEITGGIFSIYLLIQLVTDPPLKSHFISPSFQIFFIKYRRIRLFKWKDFVIYWLEIKLGLKFTIGGHKSVNR